MKTDLVFVSIVTVVAISTCALGQPVVVQDQPSDLFSVGLNGAATLNLLNGATAIEYNNMGYRTLDGLLYAVEITPTGTNSIYQIDPGTMTRITQ
jgi:hypothetical protein